MKLLKAESSRGFFLTKDGSNYAEIDTITKEDLLRLVKYILEGSTEAEFDEYNEEVIQNQAHQIVYKSIYRHLNSLKGRKQEYIDESERLYLDDYRRYVEETSPQTDETSTQEEEDGIQPSFAPVG